jgi:signal recognition particle GTPase
LSRLPQIFEQIGRDSQRVRIGLHLQNVHRDKEDCKGQFTLEDFLDQLRRMMKKMGKFQKMMSRMGGMPGMPRR